MTFLRAACGEKYTRARARVEINLPPAAPPRRGARQGDNLLAKGAIVRVCVRSLRASNLATRVRPAKS